MTTKLTPDFDPTCRLIAEYLQERLNQMSAQTVVAAIRDHDAFIAASNVDFPLLQVYRGDSRGRFLEVSQIIIEYYLLDLIAYWERAGLIRFVEVAIAQLLDKSEFDQRFEKVRPYLDTLRSQRGYLRMPSGEVYPNVKITLDIAEPEVKVI